jgi:DNA replication protein DnaC
MEISNNLKAVLKRLKLSGILYTLPDRIHYGRNNGLSECEIFELVLQDEIDRRDASNMAARLHKARCNLENTFENFDWNANISFDRTRVKDLMSLAFMERKEDVILLGPAGVGKTMIAESIGHCACRYAKKVLSIRTEALFKALNQSRADNTFEKVMRSFISPDLLIIDDFGLRAMNERQTSDIYEIILERHRKSSTILTSNRTIDEWLPLFTDPIVAQSAIDRIAHNAHQIIIDGESYRKQKGPNAKKLKQQS